MSAASNPTNFGACSGLSKCVKIHHSHEEVPDSIRRAHLVKVIGSITFARAEQLQRLLKWLGERSLGAFPVPPSEKEIATNVLNRKDFDPQSDSVVRNEMSRLRDKLDRYYSSEGWEDEIRIVSNRGYLIGFDIRGQIKLSTGRDCWA